MKSSLIIVLHSVCALLFIPLFCPLCQYVFSACVPTASCSPPDLAALRSMAAAFPPPLFSRWELAAAHNVCCGHWGPLTINCSFCVTPNNLQSGEGRGRGRGRVTELEIDMSESSVLYTPIGIPTSVCSLSALTSLRLKNLLVSGPIPDCIGNNLTHLVHLDLSINRLTGSIPLSFSRLQSLQFLALRENSLSGALPPLILPHLAHLDLHQNYFSGSIPMLNSFTHLAYLDLSQNSFSGPIPSTTTLNTFTHLAYLDLSLNSFSGPIPSPLNLTHLTHLHISANALSGSLPTLITPQLVSLNLKSNYISGSLSPLFHASNLTSLLFMSISDNQLNGVLPDFDPLHFSSLVSRIDLSRNRLTGSLPESICGFTNLSNLELSVNEFSGHVNTLEMCNFTKLEYLDLSTNLFTGPFPDWLGSLSNLGTLSVAHNRLSGSLPNSWQNLTSLSFLDLSGNSLSGAPKLPCWLFALSHLQWLYLSAMQLQTTDVVAICSPHCATIPIRFLDLSNNRFNAGILQCFSNVSLSKESPPAGDFFGEETGLNLSSNPLALDLSNPNQVKLLPKSLAILDLSSCMLRGHLTMLFFERVAPNFSLSGLYLAHNLLQGQIPGELGSMPKIETVDLSFNFFTELSPLTNGSHVANYIDLNLSNNNLRGNLSSLLARIVPNISSCLYGGYLDGGYLEDLDLSYNFLSGDIPPFPFQCLKTLKLNHNLLQGCLPNAPIPFSPLIVLSLSNNQLSGQIPTSFRNLTELLLLDLSHNKLQGNLQNMALFSNASWAEQQQFVQLRVLLMSNNHFIGTIPTSLGYVAPALHLIDFSSNALTGCIPVQALQSLPAFKITYFPAVHDSINTFDIALGGTLYEKITINMKGRAEEYPYVLQGLAGVDLSSNKLSGPISLGLGELSALVYLNLSRNNLSGPIPSDLGRLGGQLESLDMSFNELDGPIPPTFQNLTSLAVFNVSYNEGLTGPILQTPQFDNKLSYIGNPNLCSSSQLPILPNVCPDPFHKDGNGTTSAQDEPHKSMNFVASWFDEWIEIPGLLLGTIVGFLGTLWALKALKW